MHSVVLAADKYHPAVRIQWHFAPKITGY